MNRNGSSKISTDEGKEQEDEGKEQQAPLSPGSMVVVDAKANGDKFKKPYLILEVVRTEVFSTR